MGISHIPTNIHPSPLHTRWMMHTNMSLDIGHRITPVVTQLALEFSHNIMRPFVLITRRPVLELLPALPAHIRRYARVRVHVRAQRRAVAELLGARVALVDARLG